MNQEEAVFAAGCFWGVEEKFRNLEGVIETEVGYTGGSLENPSYEKVCGGSTEHAEAIRIIFDPSVLTYNQLLDFFWSIHDPTTKDRQGFDVGSQYRSAIFYKDGNQKAAAEESIKKHEAAIGSTIATELAQASEFYSAEEYHQKYIMKKSL